MTLLSNIYLHKIIYKDLFLTVWIYNSIAEKTVAGKVQYISIFKYIFGIIEARNSNIMFLYKKSLTLEEKCLKIIYIELKIHRVGR